MSSQNEKQLEGEMAGVGALGIPGPRLKSWERLEWNWMNMGTVKEQFIWSVF